jgi:hypothetical protein
MPTAAEMPAAFVLCKTGAAPKCPGVTLLPIPGDQVNQQVVCSPPHPGCGSPCLCRIFRRKTGAAKGTKFDFAFPNPQGYIVNEKGYDYEATCVEPVLPNNALGVPYTVCASGSSAKGCPQKPKPIRAPEAPVELWCSNVEGGCSAGCDCTMFQLKRDDPAATWEEAAKPGKRITPDKNYYYECMCVS